MLRRLATGIVGAALVFVVQASSRGSVRAEAAGAPDKSGCCSHHDGVCGCNAPSHELVCCDGSRSPTCGC